MEYLVREIENFAEYYGGPEPVRKILTLPERKVEIAGDPDIRLVEVVPSTSTVNADLLLEQPVPEKMLNPENPDVNVVNPAWATGRNKQAGKKRETPAKRVKQTTLKTKGKSPKRGGGRGRAPSSSDDKPSKSGSKKAKGRKNKSQSGSESSDAMNFENFTIATTSAAALVSTAEKLNFKILNIRPARKLTGRKAVPDDKKDENYYDKRLKNTVAAKRCREKKRELDAARVEMIRSQQALIEELTAKAANLENQVASYKGFVEIVANQIGHAFPPFPKRRRRGGQQ